MTTIRYLGWAGVEVEHNGHILLIDYIKDAASLMSKKQFATPSRQGSVAIALVTHLHSDHADPDALADMLAPGAVVCRPESKKGSENDRLWTNQAEEAFARTALPTIVMQPWESYEVEPFHIVAGPSVCGLGDPQRSYIVECGGLRIFHAGDTINHGHWWSLAQAAGPIDVAFLPINGPVLELPHLQPPSPFPGAMLPEEAAVAGSILKARLVVPIHHGELNKPGVYEEAPNAIQRFLSKAGELGGAVALPRQGDELVLEAAR